MSVSQTRAISAICARICSAPSAQFSPTEIGDACRIAFQNASGVWPGKVVLATFLGDAIAYRIDVRGHMFEVRAPATDVHETGADVLVAVRPERCILLLE